MTYRPKSVTLTKSIPREEMLQKYLLSYIFQNTTPVPMAQKIFSILDPSDLSLPAVHKIAAHLTEFISKAGQTATVDDFFETLPSELRSVADELFLYASGLSELENELIQNIVYEIKESSTKRWYSYYAKRDDPESAEKAMHYKKLLNTLSKSELEKTFTKV
jgi:hypothetical protein